MHPKRIHATLKTSHPRSVIEVPSASPSRNFPPARPGTVCLKPARPKLDLEGSVRGLFFCSLPFHKEFQKEKEMEILKLETEERQYTAESLQIEREH